MFKQFIARGCDGCSVAPLADYINNPIYQDLIEEDKFDRNVSDERLYLDLKASSGYTNEVEKLERNGSKINLGIALKNAATKKLPLSKTSEFLANIQSINTEILWCMKFVKYHYSYNLCSGFTKILTKICPNSDTATKISLGKQNVDI